MWFDCSIRRNKFVQVQHESALSGIRKWIVLVENFVWCVFIRYNVARVRLMRKTVDHCRHVVVVNWLMLNQLDVLKESDNDVTKFAFWISRPIRSIFTLINLLIIIGLIDSVEKNQLSVRIQMLIFHLTKLRSANSHWIFIKDYRTCYEPLVCIPRCKLKHYRSK